MESSEAARPLHVPAHAASEHMTLLNGQSVPELAADCSRHIRQLSKLLIVDRDLQL